MASYEITHRASVLLTAAEQFQQSLHADETQQEEAVSHLLGAADEDAAPSPVAFQATGNETLGFQPGIGRPAPPPITDGIAAVLFDLQTANLLVAAAIQRKEVQVAADGDPLHKARQQIATTRDELLETTSPIPFELSWDVQSATPDEAVKEFRKWSGKLLDEIVDEAAKTIDAAVKGLNKLDPSNVAKALDDIGKAVPIAADVGRLMSKGAEKLKRAIEALVALFGKDPFDKIKSEIDKVRTISSDTGHSLLATALGAQAVRTRIEEILAVDTLPVEAVDRASNSLAPLAGDFARNNRLLRALVRAIDLAAILLLMLLHLALPWLALALGVAYLSAIGGVLLLAGEYTGGRRLLHWTQGVEQIAETIPTR